MGVGVATPLPADARVLLAVTRVEGVDRMGEGDDVGLEVGVEALELDGPGVADVFWVVVGAGSLTASTQKLLPDTRPVQSALIEGFLSSSQYMQIEDGVLSIHTQRLKAPISIQLSSRTSWQVIEPS
jgi:hypothetical protein